MNALTPESFHALLALVGVVILLAALLSGPTERSGVPQVAALLALGAALGPAGLGLLDVDLGSATLQVVATLSLALVLFTDALALDVRETRSHRALALRVLGPGTLLSAAVFACAAAWGLGLPGPAAAVLGAALASTDPVLLKGLLRRPDLSAATRHALRLESGLNDVVLLPIVLVATGLWLARAAPEPGRFAELALGLFLLGPGAGVAVGVFAVGTLDLARRHVGIRRDYESLYSLGVAFTAFAAAEALGGSGFLAAFAAGLTIAAFDVELCDCFREYGETTAELLLLFAFVLLGSSLIWRGVAHAHAASWAFAVGVLLARPPIYALALLGAGVDRRSRAWIGWFGPRGLSTLLLAMLPVFAGAPGSERVFEIACLVVLLSVVAHGGALVWAARPRAGPTPPAPVAAGAAELLAADADRPIALDELDSLRASGAPVVLVDARSHAAYGASDVRIAGAVRLDPDRAPEVARTLGLPSDAWLVLFCT